MVMSNENSSREVLVFQPEKGLSASLNEFTNTAYEKALVVIKERMPKKILFLTKLLTVSKKTSDPHSDLIIHPRLCLGEGWVHFLLCC